MCRHFSWTKKSKMEATTHFFEKQFFFKSALDFHRPFKILCRTSIWGFWASKWLVRIPEQTDFPLPPRLFFSSTPHHPRLLSPPVSGPGYPAQSHPETHRSPPPDPERRSRDRTPSPRWMWPLCYRVPVFCPWAGGPRASRWRLLGRRYAKRWSRARWCLCSACPSRWWRGRQRLIPRRWLWTKDLQSWISVKKIVVEISPSIARSWFVHKVEYL